MDSLAMMTIAHDNTQDDLHCNEGGRSTLSGLQDLLRYCDLGICSSINEASISGCDDYSDATVLEDSDQAWRMNYDGRTAGCCQHTPSHDVISSTALAVSFPADTMTMHPIPSGAYVCFPELPERILFWHDA